MTDVVILEVSGETVVEISPLGIQGPPGAGVFITANVLNSVSGTGEAYTATSLLAGSDGVNCLVIFTPHVTNSIPSPTLSVNGGLAFPIGESGPDALGTGRLIAGYPYILLRTSAGAWRLLTDKWLKDSIAAADATADLALANSMKINVLTAVAGSGAAYTATSALAGADAIDGLIVFTPNVTNTIGSPTLSVNGGPAYPIGESGPDALGTGRLIAGYPYVLVRTSGGAWRLLTDKWLKTKLLDEIAARASGESVAADNVALAARIAAIHQGQQSNPLTEGSRAHDAIFLIAGGSEVWHAAPMAGNREITVAGDFVDLTWMQPGDSRPVAVKAYPGSSATLITPGGNHLLGSNARTLVSRDGLGNYHYQTTSGTLTLNGGAATPVYDMTIITAGQSLAERFLNGGGLYGLQLGWRDYKGVTTQKFWGINGATGGSGLVPASNPTNYWWDPVANGPGPCATTWKAALDAKPVAQPAPAAILWVFGQTDAGSIGVDPTMSFANYKIHLRNLLFWMQDQISTGVETPVLICPVGAWDRNFDKNVSAVRSVELDLISEQASFHLGPSYFDLIRPWDDVHLTEEATAIMGYRLAPILDNVVNAGSHGTGPRVTGITELNGGESYRIRITAQSGIDFIRPLDPEGFAVYQANGNPTIHDPITITAKSWTFVSAGVYDLTLQLTIPFPGATVMFPHGACTWSRRGRWPMNESSAPAAKGWGNILPLVPFRSAAF